MEKSEIKEITAYKFAGQIYEERADAERRLAELDLADFIEKTIGGDCSYSISFDERQQIGKWMGKNFEKLIHLLNKFY